MGVILQTISFKPAMSRVGIEAEAITSGPNKEAGSPLSELKPEHRAVLKSLVDDFYGKFVDVVKRARPNIPADLFAKLTDGRVMSGDEAAKAGLVDATGDIYAAQAAVEKLAGIEHSDLVAYHRPMEWVNSPYGRASGVPAGGTQINIAQLNFDETVPGTSAGFFYLWQPELSGR